ncbi:MAG: hypothetical protein HY744_12660 [Deltaproteobacteria bacterium]|nr:hypothetical protein [Deltaproteobacteria bacterium]
MGLTTRAWFALALLFAAGCPAPLVGPPPAPPVRPVPTAAPTASGKPAPAEPMPEAVKEHFREGLGLVAQHDAQSDWTEAACRQTADEFLQSEKQLKEQKGRIFYEAYYNAGVAFQRCKNDAQARKIFEEILRREPAFHRARVQVALYQLAVAGDAGLDEAIAEVQRAVTDSEYKNIEALVNLAMLQMRRRSAMEDDDAPNDFERAKKNLQRALAVDDAFMPAFNQLAVYYLERAKEKVGGERHRVSSAAVERRAADTQALELAALVCSQAVRKNPRYAPVHNTLGLISAELGDLSAAAQAFGNARQLDQRFFEAHMNYAAVNLKFRGFAQAEEAYRQALKLRPADYEVHLGLSLAVRGQITDVNFDQFLKEAQAQLGEAKKIAPERPETYFNEAILTQEFVARQGGTQAEAVLLQAKGLFGTFIDRAGVRAELAAEVKSAKDRIADIDRIIEFNRQSAAAAATPPAPAPPPGAPASAAVPATPPPAPSPQPPTGE